MFIEQCESVSQCTDGKPVLLVRVATHHAPNNHPCVTFEEEEEGEEEEDKGRGRTCGKHINHSSGSQVNVWISEFHLQHLLRDRKQQPEVDCGRSTSRILQQRSKALLTWNSVPWVKRYAGYFYGNNRQTSKKKINCCSCWTHCFLGHKGKVLFIYIFSGSNYWHVLLLESALQWVTWPTGSSKVASCSDSKHRCLHHFTNLERSTASCVRSTKQKALSLQPCGRSLCNM